MGNTWPLFRPFNTVDNIPTFDINFTVDWIRTADLWSRK